MCFARGNFDYLRLNIHNNFLLFLVSFNNQDVN
jgi:hypothetical protein